MSKEGERHLGASRFKEWAAKLLVVKKQPEQRLDAHDRRTNDSSVGKSVGRSTEASQFQRTEYAQRRKGKDVDVSAEYKKGAGGHVKTLANSDDASLSQEFLFNENGELVQVHVEKLFHEELHLHPMHVATGVYPPTEKLAKKLVLTKDKKSGKFKIAEKTTTPELKTWEQEFQQRLVVKSENER